MIQLVQVIVTAEEHEPPQFKNPPRFTWGEMISGDLNQPILPGVDGHATFLGLPGLSKASSLFQGDIEVGVRSRKESWLRMMERSTSEMILFTDPYCFPVQRGWLNLMIQEARDGRHAAGPVIRKDSLLVESIGYTGWGDLAVPNTSVPPSDSVIVDWAPIILLDRLLAKIVVPTMPDLISYDNAPSWICQRLLMRGITTVIRLGSVFERLEVVK